MEVVVVGHKNPDTDSVASAIALAELLNSKGLFNAVPARVGNLTPETRYILDVCGFKEPMLVTDVRPRVSNIMTKNVTYVVSGTPVKKAGDILILKGVRSVPVVDKDLRVLGLFSVESFSRSYLKDFLGVRVKLVNIPLRNIVDVVGCEVVNGDLDTLISGHIYVGAMSLNTIRARYSFTNNVVIVGDREEVQLEAISSKASLLIITGGLRPSDNVINLAKRYGIPILISPYDTYTTARLVDLSRPVDLFMDVAETVLETTYVQDVVRIMSTKLVRSIVVTDEYGRLTGIVTRSDLIKDYRRKIALVDHNERSQSVDGIDEAQILAVIDHHRVSGDIKTSDVILFRTEPVGSTATLIWKLMKEWGIKLRESTLKLLLYAVLSDTLLLKSPTTTYDDLACVRELSNELGINLSDAINVVRYALSLNEPQDINDVIRSDIKEYEVDGYRFAIAQIFTVDPNRYLKHKDELLSRMCEAADLNGFKLYMLVITNYVENVSYIMVCGDTNVVEEAFNERVVSGYIVLKGVTSRKSQILPKLLNVVREKRRVITEGS